MSSRAGRKENRVPYDFYATPPTFAKAGLSCLPTIDPKYILDPGAGKGVWGDCAKNLYPKAALIGIEPQAFDKPKTYNYWFNDDFLTSQFNVAPFFDLVVGNPPYNQATAFIERSISLLNPGGYLIFLLRLGLLESEARYEFWQHYHPLKIIICSKRPSFISTQSSSSDSAAYGFFIWQKGNLNCQTTLSWLLTQRQEKSRMQIKGQ